MKKTKNNKGNKANLDRLMIYLSSQDNTKENGKR